MARAPKWSRLLIGGQLALATACAMLAKVSSPLFCVGPGLVALYYLCRPGQTADSDTRIQAVTTAGCRDPARPCDGWLVSPEHSLRGRTRVDGQLRTCGGADGKSERFLPSLKYWLSAVDVNFFSGLYDRGDRGKRVRRDASPPFASL